MRRLIGTALALTALAAARPPRCVAQSPAELIAAARVQIDELNADSALSLLRRALDGQLTQQQRVYVFTLLGITLLNRDDLVAGQQAFEQALRLDITLRIDTLAELDSDALPVFNLARQAVGAIAPAMASAGPALALGVTLPNDTLVPPREGRYLFFVTPSRRARVFAAIAPADTPDDVLWGDTLSPGATEPLAWIPLTEGGEPVAEGRYLLRTWAVDSLGDASQITQRILVVSREAADTAAHPVPREPLPEVERLRRGSPGALAAGLGLGVAAALLPTAVGNSELNSGLPSDGTAYAVAGVVSLASVVGFFKGHRVRQLPENAQRNLENRAEHERLVQATIAGNARLMAARRVRVRVEGAGAGP
jgi:hypothetical protein